MEKNKHNIPLSAFIVVVLILLAVIVWEEHTNNELRATISKEKQMKKLHEALEIMETLTETPTASPEPTPTPIPILQPKELVLLDNEHLTITFEEMTMDQEENINLQVYIVSKSDREILIDFADVTVNDEMTMLNGPYGYVLPHKLRRCDFLFSGKGLGINSLEEIKDIECSIVLQDFNTYEQIGEPHKTVMDFTGGTE